MNRGNRGMFIEVTRREKTKELKNLLDRRHGKFDPKDAMRLVHAGADHNVQNSKGQTLFDILKETNSVGGRNDDAIEELKELRRKDYRENHAGKFFDFIDKIENNPRYPENATFENPTFKL
jgi:hypothetical protein